MNINIDDNQILNYKKQTNKCKTIPNTRFIVELNVFLL